MNDILKEHLEKIQMETNTACMAVHGTEIEYQFVSVNGSDSVKLVYIYQ